MSIEMAGVVTCKKHTVFNAGCNECISSCYGIDPETYYEAWIELIGDKLGCGKQPGMIMTAIDEMIAQESRMKKMIVNLRKRRVDNLESQGIIELQETNDGKEKENSSN